MVVSMALNKAKKLLFQFHKVENKLLLMLIEKYVPIYIVQGSIPGYVFGDENILMLAFFVYNDGNDKLK